MLKSLTPKLVCPTCKDLQSELALHVFDDGVDGHVQNGILTCARCSAWYPIDDELLELVDEPLLDPVDTASFVARFATQFAAAGIGPDQHRTTTATQAEYEEQLKQRRHFDNFAEQSDSPVFEDYTKSRFILAASRRFYQLWSRRLGKPGGWILDIGCGTANSSFPFADRFTVVGFDVSKKVIRRDIEQARARGCRGTTTFLVGDGGFLAFKTSSFEYAQTFGALHHMPNADETIPQIDRILKPGGLYFGVENNKSVFRGIFDLMMKVRPLWIEEAGDEPLISRNMVVDWCRGLRMDVSSETSIFVPPHLINLLPQAVADRVVDWSDRVFSRVPFFGAQGGQIVFTLAKAPDSAR